MKTSESKTGPRGLRNCNPLNIRHSAGNRWVGQLGHEAGFCVFVDIRHGLRAAFRLLRTYQMRYGCWSVGDIIRRWAPETENNTQGYIRRVCDCMRCEAEFIPHFGTVEEKEDCCRMVAAMAMVELGGEYITPAAIEEAYEFAFFNTPDYGSASAL